MSALVFKLLLHLCVWSRIFQANGIQNQRYPSRFDNNQWRFGKRQDFLAKSRFFIWKPALNHAQMYSNIKTPVVPFNFNRFGVQSPPIMAPVHQSYMFAIPTKVNYAPYQPVKEIEEKRKPGNLHHITIINAIMPKPYLPTTPTYNNPTTTFQNYRTNSKQLYHQYFNTFGRQNMDNLNKINSQQLQLQQQQYQPPQMVFPSSSLALQQNKPTTDYLNGKTYNAFETKTIEHEGNEMNTPVTQCGRKTKNDSNISTSDVLYYYCNNRITNYKNPTQQQLLSIPPTTSSTSTTTTTTTTTTTPTTTIQAPSITTTKASYDDLHAFTTKKPIFLPTPYTPLENRFVPITSATILDNFAADSENDENFKQQRQKYRQTKYDHQRQAVSRYEDIKRQQQYTTAAAYDNMKFHSFFTIEDAVTRAPDIQVFNDPYQAYRHARRQQINNQKYLSPTTKLSDTTTTTIKPRFKSFFDDLDEEYYPESYSHSKKQLLNYQPQIATTTTKIPDITTSIKPAFKSFFDDLNDDDYIIRGPQQYDYSLFNSPKKSVYHKYDFNTENHVPRLNQIIDHTPKTEEHDFTTISETFGGKPKIKEHHFGLFKTISPTTSTLPPFTTYKPNFNFKNDILLTTQKIPSLTSYNPQSITYTTTADTVFGNSEKIIEKENNLLFLNEVLTTTSPLTTTTEKKPTRLISKPALLLKSSTLLKYPKQRRLHKSYKNLTSTTTKATTQLKKVPKYQRQYKTKKLKQFKHLYTTTSSTTTATPTTTAIVAATVDTHTKRMSVRIIPTTSTTEEPTTKKSVSQRTFSTTEVPKQNNIRQQWSLSTEATKRKKIKRRTSTASTLAVSEPSARPESTRRGSKRANITRSEKDASQVAVPKVHNKNRRRLTTSSSSTTTRPMITRSNPELTSTSTFYSTSTATSIRASSTSTTMKSIMRIANSKSRTKIHNDQKLSNKASDKVKTDRQTLNERISLKSITSTAVSIPPLPIEIYFKKSHTPKI